MVPEREYRNFGLRYFSGWDAMSTYLVRGSVALRGSHGMLFVSQRPQRKKFMPAGFATQRWKPENPPERPRHHLHTFRGDALQCEVAANLAMRIPHGAKWNRGRVKSCLARFASPRQDARDTEEIVEHRPAPGTPGVRGVTDRATGWDGPDQHSPFSMPRVGQKRGNLQEAAPAASDRRRSSFGKAPRRDTISLRSTHARLYRRARSRRHQRKIARARNLAESISRLHYHHALSPGLLRLPQDRYPRLWHHHHPIHA